MRYNRFGFTGLALLSAMLIFIVSCGSSGGGGGSSSSPGSAPSGGQTARVNVSGVAATGAPIEGSVWLKDATGFEFGPVGIGPDGGFSIDVTDLTPPFYLYAEETSSGIRYYSGSQGPGISNINPATNVVLEVAAFRAGSDPDTLYGPSGSPPVPLAQAIIDQALTDLQKVLDNMLTAYGVQNVNPFLDPFVVRMGLDEFFDDIHVGVDRANNEITFRDGLGRLMGRTNLNLDVLTPFLNITSPLIITASGGGYIQQTVTDMSLNVDEALLPAGQVDYSNGRTLFSSTSITSMTAKNGIVTIKGTGSVNGTAGYSFTAQVRSGPDEMGMEIKDAGGSILGDSIGIQPVSSGGFTLTIIAK